MIYLNGWIIIKCIKAATLHPGWLNVLRERKYRISDARMSYRQINSLEASEVIPNTRKGKKGWRKFSLMELLHLRIVSECRKYGISNAQIKSLNSTLYSPTMEFSPTDEKLSDGEIGVMAAMASIRVSLIITSEGNTEIVDTDGISRFLGNKKPEIKSFAIFNLNELLLETTKKEVYFAENIGDYIDFYSAMEKAVSAPNKDEIQILEKIRDKRYSEIVIRKDDKGFTIHAERDLPPKILNEMTGKKFEEQGNVRLNTVIRDKKVVSVKATETFRLPSEPK